jgi:hypothetical protein
MDQPPVIQGIVAHPCRQGAGFGSEYWGAYEARGSYLMSTEPLTELLLPDRRGPRATGPKQARVSALPGRPVLPPSTR